MDIKCLVGLLRLAGAQVADIISFQKLRDATAASIVHTGDVSTTDLERIYVQPEAMEKRGVDNIFLVVNNVFAVQESDRRQVGR